MMEPRRVVVTGLGLVTGLGRQVEENWRKALAGQSGVTAFAGPGSSGCPVRAAGAVSAADWAAIAARFPEENRHAIERRTLFALWAADEAWRDAGSPCGGPRAGVALGAGLGILRLEDQLHWAEPDGQLNLQDLGTAPDLAELDSQLQHRADEPSWRIARRLGLAGPSATVTTACASAGQAIGTAFRMVRRGEADWIVAGGADSMIHPVGLVYFVLLGAASTSAEPPDTVCRPFDRRRSGLVMGEGAGVVILEAEAHARARGARIYAELAGYGASFDAWRVTAPHPEGAGAARAMRAALADAGLDPGGIDYINAHGTGTRLNDVAEAQAIRAVFGAEAAGLAVSSSKSLIGHLLAACGGPECVLTVLSVNRDEIHPTRNLEQPDPKCGLDCVPGTSRRRIVRAALSNSFGFGGQNACLAVRKYIPREEHS